MLVQSHRNIGSPAYLDFATAALSFVGKWLTNSSVVLNMFDSRWSEQFSLMLFAGLFVRTGGRYQMTIPDVIDISKVHERLADWLKRMDQEKLSPSDLFVILSERDAKAWEARLRHMDVAARVADRATLLDAPW